MNTKNWFEVDKVGLAKLMEKKGKWLALFELISNGFDTNAKAVKVSFKPMAYAPKVWVIVEDDDPDGFKNLTHAFTLFAESEKKVDATKRGRFNLGEKLVLALCDQAIISTTTGTVTFNEAGRTMSRTRRREVGSDFTGLMGMTRQELADCKENLKKILPPPETTLTVGEETIHWRKPLRAIEAQLPTEIADAEGNLSRSSRKTRIEILEPRHGEVPMLYELGIPVVETDDRWHVNVLQKVPLNKDRDNVTPAYLRQIRTLVLNEMHDQLDKEDANTAWVRSATSDEDCSAPAIEKVLDLRFGEKRVAYDPSDAEANSLAVSKGYTVVHGGMMNKTEWLNAKEAGAILPAGQVTPSPKPFSPDGDSLKVISKEDQTEGMKKIISYVKLAALRMLHHNDLQVTLALEPKWPYNATYGKGHLVFNVGKLGYAFFEEGITARLNRLMIHEFGHHFSNDHLSSEYHDALCKLGARLVDLVLMDSKVRDFYP